jgi:cytochrome P450
MSVADALALARAPTRLETLSSLASRADILELRLPFRPFFLLNHPSHVQQVLVTDAARFSRGLAIDRSRIILGHSLLTSDGDDHRRQRRQLQPAFHRQVIAEHVGAMASAAARAVEAWPSGGAVDVSKAMLGLALASVVETLFGEDGSGWADEVGEALGVLFDTSQRLLLPFGPTLVQVPLPAHRRFARARASLLKTVDHLLDRSRTRRTGVLGPLLADRVGDDAMSDSEARDHVMTLLLAGHETTACALAWTWHLVAEHPHVEARLHEEIDALVGRRLPTSDDLPRLVYTERVFAEAMRLYPPVWGIGRRVSEPVEIDGHRIPRGAFVMVSPWTVHRDERFWPDPLRFDPDRFSSESSRERVREAYFPFGDGRRRCIGEPLAWLLGVTALAVIGSRVRLRSDASKEIAPLTYLFLTHPGARASGATTPHTRGLPMIVESR